MGRRSSVRSGELAAGSAKFEAAANPDSVLDLRRLWGQRVASETARRSDGSGFEGRLLFAAETVSTG
jgi:hypothetical protein